MTLVERLRAYAKDQGGWHNIDETCEEAADRIESLEAELEKAREAALEEAAKVADNLSEAIRQIGTHPEASTEKAEGMSLFCEVMAAAIRSLSHKEG